MYVTKTKFRVVVVTCANLAEARKIARAAIEQRLAACVNIATTPVESIYRWKEKIESAREYLLVIKTAEKRVKELQRTVKVLHSYDVPEFIVLAIASGSKEYLDWLNVSTKPDKPARRK
jgi:periplasmic divalent cation tolerance protein